MASKTPSILPLLALAVGGFAIYEFTKRPAPRGTTVTVETPTSVPLRDTLRFTSAPPEVQQFINPSSRFPVADRNIQAKAQALFQEVQNLAGSLDPNAYDLAASHLEAAGYPMQAQDLRNKARALRSGINAPLDTNQLVRNISTSEPTKLPNDLLSEVQALYAHPPIDPAAWDAEATKLELRGYPEAAKPLRERAALLRQGIANLMG